MKLIFFETSTCSNQHCAFAAAMARQDAPRAPRPSAAAGEFTGPTPRNPPQVEDARATDVGGRAPHGDQSLETYKGVVAALRLSSTARTWRTAPSRRQKKVSGVKSLKNDRG